jgi:hypothetical protein
MEPRRRLAAVEPRADERRPQRPGDQEGEGEDEAKRAGGVPLRPMFLRLRHSKLPETISGFLLHLAEWNLRVQRCVNPLSKQMRSLFDEGQDRSLCPGAAIRAGHAEGEGRRRISSPAAERATEG